MIFAIVQYLQSSVNRCSVNSNTPATVYTLAQRLVVVVCRTIRTIAFACMLLQSSGNRQERLQLLVHFASSLAVATFTAPRFAGSSLKSLEPICYTLKATKSSTEQGRCSSCESSKFLNSAVLANSSLLIARATAVDSLAH